MPFLNKKILDFNWSFKLGCIKAMYAASKFFLVLVCLEAFANIFQL